MVIIRIRYVYKIKDVKQYAVKKEYGEENATGVETSISISGRFFREGADGSIRYPRMTEPLFQSLHTFTRSVSL